MHCKLENICERRLLFLLCYTCIVPFSYVSMAKTLKLKLTIMQHKINILIHISIKFVHDLKVESIASFSLRVEQSNTLVTVKVFFDTLM